MTTRIFKITHADFVSNAPRNLLAKSPVALQMPFAAHGFAPCGVPLSVKQNPAASARGGRPGAGIVPGQTAIEIVCPADVGPIPIFAGAAENVDETFHSTVLARPGKFFFYER